MSTHKDKPRSRAKQLARKARHARNRQVRADLYRDMQGSNGWNNNGMIAKWHSTLRGLSAGVGG